MSIALNLGPSVPAGAATAAAAPTAQVIDEYVRIGLASNLALQSAHLDVEQALAELRAARANYWPALTFQSRYTQASGGRVIEIPQAGLRFPFLRPTEQDSKLSLNQPLFAPAIPAAVRASRAQLDAERYGREALARALKRDITVAYLHWLQADRSLGIVTGSVDLLAENHRISQALHANGKVTEDQVLRARAEQLAAEQQRIEATNARRQAQSYLNFLLNRTLDTALMDSEVAVEVERARLELASLKAAARGARPERAQLASSRNAAAAGTQAARSERLPSLMFAADGGAQGERYQFGRGRNYSTLSLLLRWEVFDGGARRARVDSARLAERKLALQSELLDRQIELEVQQALDSLQATDQWLSSSAARVSAARAAFRIAARKRDEGVINQVEFLDARNALTQAELTLNLTRFEVLLRQAELDHATAAGELELTNSGVAR